MTKKGPGYPEPFSLAFSFFTDYLISLKSTTTSYLLKNIEALASLIKIWFNMSHI